MSKQFASGTASTHPPPPPCTPTTPSNGNDHPAPVITGTSPATVPSSPPDSPQLKRHRRMFLVGEEDSNNKREEDRGQGAGAAVDVVDGQVECVVREWVRRWPQGSPAPPTEGGCLKIGFFLFWFRFPSALMNTFADLWILNGFRECARARVSVLDRDHSWPPGDEEDTQVGRSVGFRVAWRILHWPSVSSVASFQDHLLSSLKANNVCQHTRRRELPFSFFLLLLVARFS